MAVEVQAREDRSAHEDKESGWVLRCGQKVAYSGQAMGVNGKRKPRMVPNLPVG